LVANYALILNIIMLMGGLSILGATLTLPGIAGIILTIGMAVDANVLIFERIREELAIGKTVRSAIDTGFARAFGTIIDSNLTT
jgi:preprotein translocase subunit SecD